MIYPAVALDGVVLTAVAMDMIDRQVEVVDIGMQYLKCSSHKIIYLILP